MLKKKLSQNFGLVILEKMSVGGSLVAFQFFWSLNNGIRTFNLHSNEPYHEILGPLGQYEHPCEKNKQTNKHVSTIFPLGKNTNFHIFADRILKPPE